MPKTSRYPHIKSLAFLSGLRRIRVRANALSRGSQLSGLALILLALLVLSAPRIMAADPLPNIVLINADDLGLGDEGVSAMGFRDGNWKLIMPRNPNKKAGAKADSGSNAQLFNLADDPGEKVNLAQKDPQRLESLVAQL